MGKCINHPEIETRYHCIKHDTYLCQDCLECRDPDLYCKFRPSCPIHFMSSKGFDKEKETLRGPGTVNVRFFPGDHEIFLNKGTTLLSAAQKAGIYINASCSGSGSCGKCKLILESGNIDHRETRLLSPGEKEKGMVLACQAKILSDVTVRIPEEALEKNLKAAGMGKEATKKLSGLVQDIDPLVKTYSLTLDPPDLDDTVSDLERLKRGLKQQGCDTFSMSTDLRLMRQLTNAVREDNWHVRVAILQKKCSSHIVDIQPEKDHVNPLGLAVDLGTTSIVVYIVSLDTGDVISAASGHNSQAACGDDVINRIVCSEKDGVQKLKKMALSTINNLTQRALAPINETHKHIQSIVVSGNTTMVHLALGIQALYIRREPYIPTVSEFPVILAREAGLKAAPYAGVFIMPGPASYVGGDIVSGVLYTGIHKSPELTLFIDVGTNGEIVLGSNDFLMTAACSAGPAFEGGGIRWGMRAESGAIEKILLDPLSFVPQYSTVDDKPARGICGSGMVDLLSEMMEKGVIGQDGKFNLPVDHPRMTLFNEEPAFVLETGDAAAQDEDIIFTESDIGSLTLSKAAVYAGFTVLIEEIGMDFSMVEKMIITGGFGQYLDIDRAVSIGLLPDMDREKFIYMGNSSIAGAYMALLSGEHRREAIEICNKMTYVDFSSNSKFMDEFTRAQFLPHTDAHRFPSVQIRQPN
ncbi:MAG: DUF4445 domain-containing protein [Desulfobacter sp.]|nr:DUF4445 domain-containing protein [Desulfobacter sp.]